jgi:hypothetical protein
MQTFPATNPRLLHCGNRVGELSVPVSLLLAEEDRRGPEPALQEDHVPQKARWRDRNLPQPAPPELPPASPPLAEERYEQEHGLVVKVGKSPRIRIILWFAMILAHLDLRRMVSWFKDLVPER